MTESPAATPSHHWRLVDVVLLVAVLVVAGAARLAPLPFMPIDSRIGSSLTLDELWHMTLSTGRGSPMDPGDREIVHPVTIDSTSLEGAPPFYKVWTGMNGPATLHPPLYVLTLRIWREIAGGGDVAAQIYSELWGLVAIGFGFAAIRLCFDRWLAAIAMLLLAFAPVQIDLAQEVRSYSMLIALTAITLWQMSRVEVLGPTVRRGIALGAMPLVLLLTHYFAFGSCVAIGGYLLIRFRGRALAAGLIAITVGAAIYAIIWMPFAVKQLGELGAGDDFLKRDGISLWQRSLSHALAMPFQLLVDRHVGQEPLSVLSLVVYALPLIWLRRAPRLLPWWIVGTCVVGSLLALDAARGTGHLQLLRYPSAASMALPPLLILCMAVVSRRLALIAGPVMIVGVMVFSVTTPRAIQAPFDEVTRPAAARMKPGEPILFVGPSEPFWLIDAIAIHLLHERGVAPRATLRLDRRATREDVERLLASSPAGTRSLWVVCGRAVRSLDELANASFVPLSQPIAHPLGGIAFHVELPTDDASSPERTAMPSTNVSATTRPR